MMKLLLLIATLLSSTAFANDPLTYLRNFDNRVYSLRTKGVKDFVVDVKSSELLKRVNEQQIFGTVKDLRFRTYWTANPERLAIEVIGLPAGFKEAKEELKGLIYAQLEYLLPLKIEQKFQGYKFSPGPQSKEFTAKDSTGIAQVPSYVLRFDAMDKLVETIGKKHVGTFSVKHDFNKDAFADGKWVLKSLETINEENGHSLKVVRSLRYGSSQGIGVLTQIQVNVEQRSLKDNSKTLSTSETYNFENYQINNGAALKHFLGNAP